MKRYRREILIQMEENNKTTLKDVQSVELDLLKKLISVCNKYGLKYFACGGTCLGAVRHKGMIPWDDDIDIAMPRADYERLLKLTEVFVEPYFLQYYGREKGYYRSHAQLRNSQTTAILFSEKGRCTFNQGIFIDIFPIDYIDSNSKTFQKKMKLADQIMRNINWYTTYNSIKNHSLKGKIRYLLLSIYFCFNSFDKEFERHEELCKECILDIGDEMGYITFGHANPRWISPRYYFFDTINVPFEDIELPIPKEYDKLLTQQYGEYMIPVKANSEHGKVIFNAFTSYKKYLNGKY